jgi:hypothetical protein
MALPTINIDDVVREVLAQLGLAPAGGASPNGEAAANGATSSASKSPSKATVVSPPPAQTPAKVAAGGNGEFVVRSRVVALAELQDRLSGIRKLVVPPQAIVTPAVRDELRRRNIALVFGKKDAAAARTSAMRLVLMVTHGALDPAGLVGGLTAEGIAVDVQTSDCLLRATDELAAELSKGETLGVLATPYVPAALCLANRLAGIRAVIGLDARTVAADTASVGANLLVVNPAGLGLFQLRQLVIRFYQEPKHECPQVFCERLG